MVAGSLGKTRIQSTMEPEVGLFPLVSYLPLTYTGKNLEVGSNADCVSHGIL